MVVRCSSCVAVVVCCLLLVVAFVFSLSLCWFVCLLVCLFVCFLFVAVLVRRVFLLLL